MTSVTVFRGYDLQGGWRQMLLLVQEMTPGRGLESEGVRGMVTRRWSLQPLELPPEPLQSRRWITLMGLCVFGHKDASFLILENSHFRSMKLTGVDRISPTGFLACLEKGSCNVIQVSFSDQSRLFRIIYNSILFWKGFEAADGQAVEASVSLKVSVKRDVDRNSADARGTTPSHPPAGQALATLASSCQTTGWIFLKRFSKLLS